MSKHTCKEYDSGRQPCPHCGGTILGIGYSSNPVADSCECSVKCRMCGSRGPFCTTEDEAWNGWNSRVSSSLHKRKTIKVKK